MGWYIARRLGAALITVWIVATAGFLLVEIIPGDPARQLAGPGASVESLAAIREAYGFGNVKADEATASSLSLVRAANPAYGPKG